jgi:opacity protein-like surface antigen
MTRSSLSRALWAVLAALLLSACSSSEVVPSSGPRSPTTAEQVKIYQKAPKKYEKLGVVTVSRAEGATWDERGDATAGFDILKRKAAALGANGLLLTVPEGGEEKRATAGYHGTYYQVPVKGPRGSVEGLAQAIYVLEEK